MRAGQQIRRTLALTASLLAALAVGMAGSKAQNAGLAADFRNWIEREIWPAAAAVGVTRAVFDNAFVNVTPDLGLPELVLPGAAPGPAIDQAEFRSPAGYFNEAGIRTLVSIGTEEMRNWGSTLAAIEARYGVPREIVLAIWARESAYGRASIPHNAITALATQAFLGRRAEKFRGELIAALQILQSGDVTAREMRSSWAGGLGHPQFLPSTYLTYAVDFDGDGRRDIWRSVPDALASIANYLARHGWNSAFGWGAEIDLPAGVSCRFEGPHQGMPLSAWSAFGIAVPTGSTAGNRYLLLPAGRFGPAFLVTDNFYVLKDYNESDLYALFVGHLADRIASGGGAFRGAWQPIEGLTHAEIQNLQQRMEAAGYDVGGADGLIGFRTRISVGAVQAALGLAETCFPDRAFFEAVG